MAQEPESTVKRAELPMRLTRLRVKNFRSIADIDIPLSPLTVLVGPNGSGKSNVVDALRFVRDVFARGLDQAVMDREGMGVIQRWGTESISLQIDLSIEREEAKKFLQMISQKQVVTELAPVRNISYGFTFQEGAKGKIIISSEYLQMSFHDETATLEIERIQGEIQGKLEGAGFVQNTLESSIAVISQQNSLLMPEGLFSKIEEFFVEFDDEYQFFAEQVEFFPWGDVDHAFRQFDEFVKAKLFYTLNPNDLRQPQQVLRENPLDEKGRNLAAVLRRLASGDDSDWKILILTLRQAIIGFDELQVETVGGYLATKLLYQTNNSTKSRASYLGQESDGTIRMLGLLAALLQEPSQPFISIEEPEANIHPGALAVLAGVIDEASLRSQILVTTHSPDMLDHLPVESFLVVEKVGDTTHVGPLDASQIASVRKRLFTPGELFRMEGLQRQAESAS